MRGNYTPNGVMKIKLACR